MLKLCIELISESLGRDFLCEFDHSRLITVGDVVAAAEVADNRLEQFRLFVGLIDLLGDLTPGCHKPIFVCFVLELLFDR